MRRVRFIILCLSITSVTAIAVLAFTKREGITHRIGVWRSLSLVKKSEELGEKGQWEEAFKVSLAAWQLNEGDIDVLRRLHEAALESRSPQLLQTAKALFYHPRASISERLEVVSLFLGLGDLVTVAALFSLLTPEEKSTPEAKETAVRFLLARNQPAEAWKWLSDLVGLRDESKDRLLEAKVLSALGAANDEAARAAQDVIDRLIAPESGVEMAVSAFLLLDRIPTEKWEAHRFVNVGERLEGIARGEKLPVAVYLLESRIRIALQPENRASILTSVSERFFEEARHEVADWLIVLGETDLVREALEGDAAADDPVVFSILIKTCFRDGRWEEAAALLRNPPQELEPSSLFALNAVVAKANGEHANARNWWERSLRQAELSGGRRTYLKIAKLAASSGNEAIRNRAVAAALKQPSLFAIPAADVSFLFSHFVEEDAAADFLDISLEMLGNEPDNPMLVNNVAWLTLMNGKSAAGFLEKLESFAVEYNETVAFQTTLALAYNFEGRAEEAHLIVDRLLEGLSSDELTELGATDIAVIQMIQIEVGKGTDPGVRLPDLDWNDMMAIERAFFEKALGSGGRGREVFEGP